MNENEIIENEICPKCYQAESFRDLGSPEEVFKHCYSKECPCGCYKNTQEAVLKMIEIYNKIIQGRFQQKFK